MKAIMKNKIFKLACLMLLASVGSAAYAAKPKPPVEEAKAAVKDTLRDPASAQFKNIKINSVGDVCGQFNAKNSFGGYGEFEYFRYEVKNKLLTNREVTRLEAEIEQDKLTRRAPGFSDPDFKKYEQMKDKIAVKYEFIKKIEGCTLD
jgi:hypothetical protein